MALATPLLLLADPFHDLLAGDLPRLLLVELGDHLPLETLVMPLGLAVAEGIGEERQGELGRSRTAIAPFKAGRRMVAEVEA